MKAETCSPTETVKFKEYMKIGFKPSADVIILNNSKLIYNK